jgi:hypothetical protein
LLGAGVPRQALGDIIRKSLAELQRASGRARTYSFRVTDWDESQDDFAPLGERRHAHML